MSGSRPSEIMDFLGANEGHIRIRLDKSGSISYTKISGKLVDIRNESINRYHQRRERR